MTYAELIDDPDGVPDSSILYRRVGWEMVGGRNRYAPGAKLELRENHFTDYSEEAARNLGYPRRCMSVGVDHVLRQHDQLPEKMLEGCPHLGLVAILAGDLRNLVRLDGTACPQGVMLAPTKDEPWHTVVFDLSDPTRKKSAARSIASKATWVVPLVN